MCRLSSLGCLACANFRSTERNGITSAEPETQGQKAEPDEMRAARAEKRERQSLQVCEDAKKIDTIERKVTKETQVTKEGLQRKEQAKTTAETLTTPTTVTMATVTPKTPTFTCPPALRVSSQGGTGAGEGGRRRSHGPNCDGSMPGIYMVRRNPSLCPGDVRVVEAV